jgi:hypothetical protein
MITIIEKSVGERICRSRPTLRMTNSTKPRVFTNTPADTDSRQVHAASPDTNGADYQLAGYGDNHNQATLENEIDILSPKSQIVRVLADGFTLVYGLPPGEQEVSRPAVLSTG